MDGWQRLSLNFNVIWHAGFTLKSVIPRPDGGKDMFFERLPTSTFHPGTVMMWAVLDAKGMLTAVWGT
ncbi:MAG: hypothetical protein JNK46_18380 [Methylobacteriaceae bacterium]|nr:hypothetical protein [Methylobacteriaceae bacterium]